MSSPLHKICSFSRLFSASNPISPKPFSPQTASHTLRSALKSTSTASSSRGKVPAASSTPKSLSAENKPLYDADTSQIGTEPSFATTPLCSSVAGPVVLEHGSVANQPYNANICKSSSVKTRKRHFGVSDIPLGSKQKNYSTIRSNFTHQKRSKSQKKRCFAFSTTVAPVSTPNHEMENISHIMRLGGVALSPSSFSWSSQSPVTWLQDSRRTNHTTPLSSAVFIRGFDFDCAEEQRNKKLLEANEQCPLGKFYFWEEDESELTTNDLLGRGGFGRVFEGIYRGRKVAIKQLENSFKSRQTVLETLQGEMNGLRLNHPNIVRTLVIIQTKFQVTSGRSACFVIMEFAGNKNLSHIINDADETIPPSRRYKFSMDILTGLAYLHNKDLAHLDLKPSNVVVTSEDRCKLCDFGSCLQVQPRIDISVNARSSRVSALSNSESMMNNYAALSAQTSQTSSKWSTESAKSSSQLMGTFIYRAPELLRGYVPSTKSDMFSFSITAWQMWSRELPYSGQHNHTVVFAVVATGARPRLPTFSSEKVLSQEELSEKNFFDVVAASWNAEADQRPSAESAIGALRLCQVLQFEDHASLSGKNKCINS